MIQFGADRGGTDLARLSWVYVALGVVLGALHLWSPSESHRLLVSLAAAVLVAFAVALSAMVNRPDPRMWPPMILILACLAVGHILRPEPPMSEGAELRSHLLILVGHCLLIVMFALVVRSRAYRDLGSIMADGLILALGAWLVGWVLLTPTRNDLAEPSTLLVVLRALDQPVVAVVLFLLFTVLLADTARLPSLMLLYASVGAALGTFLLHTLSRSHAGGIPLRVTNTPLIVGALLAAAGLLHPTIRRLFGPNASVPGRSLLSRLVIATSAIVVPIVALATTDPVSMTDRVARVVLASVLAIVVVLRVLHTVRSNETSQSELMRAARTDQLTLLPNRELLMEYVARALSDSWRTGTRPTVMLVDVDRFKNINDSLGHVVGDAVLCTVAERLVRVLPDDVVVARASGDEFVVLAPATRQPSEAVALAEAALGSFREPMPLRQGDVFIAASIGVAQANPTTTTKAEDLLRQADTAMYRAKDAGRNRVVVFDESMLERVSHRLEMETALYRALERRELLLYHQPIIDLSTGEVSGFEALMRWQRADGVLVSPAEFIPIAEETGMIVPIGGWALLEALCHLGEWIREGACSPTATMSVNVSPRQLHDPHFVSVVDEALRRSEMAPEHLWIEVTEGIMIAEPLLAKTTLDALCQMGVRVAVDDFGTGYSSLSLLQQFPIQRIKIDRSFVTNLNDDDGARSLVRTIIAMGESLGLDLVAEGVETIGHVRALNELGCSKAQGFLISKPVPADAVRSTVAALDRLIDSPLLRSVGPN